MLPKDAEDTKPEETDSGVGENVCRLEEVHNEEQNEMRAIWSCKGRVASTEGIGDDEDKKEFNAR